MAPSVILYDAKAMDLGLRDKVAIITGSSRGLGLASAKALAAEGCFVTISGRTHATLHAAAREVAKSAGGDDRVLGVEADLAQADGVKRVIDRTVDRFGGIDVLVNSVGAGPRWRPPRDVRRASGRRRFDHTLLPAVRASRLAVPHMTRRGGGSIIIIASIFGREAGGRMTYNAVKAAEISLAKSLAQQLAPSNIRVNSVSPGSFLFEGGSWWKRQQENPGGDRRIREARAAVRPFWPSRRTRRRGGLPGLIACQLDQRHLDRGGWLPEPGVLAAVREVHSPDQIEYRGSSTQAVVARIVTHVNEPAIALLEALAPASRSASSMSPRPMWISAIPLRRDVALSTTAPSARRVRSTRPSACQPWRIHDPDPPDRWGGRKDSSTAFSNAGNGVGERAHLLVRLAEEYVRQDKGRIEFQRLLALLDRFLVLARSRPGANPYAC